MGILGFLQLSLYCFELLAWPIVALVYPLFASIRAIETNSNYHMKKLVTYWIIFSLISLFELTFAKLLEWFTIWPYMKLIAICWLVMPRFGHAYNAYTSIIQMRSNGKMQCFVDWLIKQDEGKTVDTNILFPSVVKKFIKENGSEALEELISNMPKNTKTSVDAKEEIGPVEKKEKATPVEAKVAEKETIRAEFVEILPTPTNSSSSSDKVQKQWTCAVCQVTTSSEITLKSHLQGQRHKLRCAELTAKKQARKEKYVAEAKRNAANKKPADHSINQSNNTRPQEKHCRICNISCSGDLNFKSHIIGKKHLEKLQELAASVTASQP